MELVPLGLSNARAFTHLSPRAGKKTKVLRVDVGLDTDALRVAAAEAVKAGVAVALFSVDADKNKMVVYVAVPEVRKTGLLPSSLKPWTPVGSWKLRTTADSLVQPLVLSLNRSKSCVSRASCRL